MYVLSLGMVVFVVSKKPTYKHPLVEIQWIDAETDHGWEEDHEVEVELPIAVTIGFLVRETDDAFLIASTYSGTSTNARIKIPKGMIKEYKLLK